jgi:hypothetical protein
VAAVSKLTPEVQRTVCDYIRACVPKSTACLAAGIHRSTMAEWMKRGRAGEQPYAEFVAAMDEAEAQGEVYLVNSVKEGALSDPKLALDALKLRYHRRWNPAIKTEAKVQHSGAVAVQFYIPDNGRGGNG